jgi:hypothetical protein
MGQLLRDSRISLALLFGFAITLAGCSGGSGNSGTPPPSAPAVSNVSPSTVAAGSAVFTLSVTGTNFQPQAVVNCNGTALATTFVSSSSLSAAVPASLAATGSVENITVTNPDGQASTAGSPSQQITVTNPAPTLTGITPSLLYAGGTATTFTLTGTNFNSSSAVLAGTTSLSTTFVSATQLTALAPPAVLDSASTLGFTVSNPAPGGGTSQSLPITVIQPTATLTSLSPSSVTAGSPALTVTLTGTGFTPTAAVYSDTGYVAEATTYVSSTSIQFTLLAQQLTSTGNLSITVRDPASYSAPSNALTFQVVNPVPVLNSISPSSVTAGAPNFVLTLTGSNFVSSSTILVNGTPVQPNSYPAPTSASVDIPASAVSTVGPVSITVSNPTPGGGTSAPQTLNVISASNRIRNVNVAAADLGWDSVHNLVIASTLSSSATNPNSIVAINPAQGTITTAVALPSQPAGIAVTADGSYVYVTLPVTGQVERFKLPALTPDITFGLGNDSGGNFYNSMFVAAAPGLPHTVAITRHASSDTPYGATGGVAVYDDGVARPNIAVPSGYYNSYDTLLWGSDATTLYATNTVISTADVDTFAVNASGVTLLSDRTSILGEFVRNLAFDPTTGRLVDGYGNVVNATTGASAGQFIVPNTLTYEENPVALDTTQRIAFYVNVNAFYTDPPNGTYIEAFNLDQFNYINSMLVEGLNGPSTIIRWGTSGLAVNGSSQIYLIDGSFVAPSGISSAVGSYIAPSPTLNAVSPVAVPVGSADTLVTLTGRDFTPASEVTWNNQTLPIDSVSDTQLVVTIPAASLTQAMASPLIVTNGPGTGNSNSLGFTVLPDLGANTRMNVLNISGEDMVWDSTRSLLYVAVPLSDPSIPNTVAVINPTTTAVQQTIPVADKPSAISLSDDAQYLYVGSYAQAIVQRYSLPSFSLGLTIPTGAGVATTTVGSVSSCTFPVAVKVAPGNPQTIAVTNGNQNIEPTGCGGVAIYDNATPRSDTVGYFTGGDFTTLTWGATATTLFGQSDAEITPQSLHGLTVSPSGVTLSSTLNSGGLGAGVHFDTGTNLLYSDSGVITNPVGPIQVGTFSTGGLVVTDSTLHLAYVLTLGSSTNAGQGASTYTLDIYNLNTLALVKSITLPDVLGYPTRMVRWGSNGLAFVTTGQFSDSGIPGALYLLQGANITGTP